MAPPIASRKLDIRLAVALLLLAPTIFFTWNVWKELGARRLLRADRAELSHIRYGLFSADRWVEQILPILNRQIDALDLVGSNRASLRPMAERALYRLLDQVKEQLAPKPAPGAPAPGFAAQAAAMMANSLIATLRPKVPQFAGTVLDELGSKENRQAIKNYLASVINEGAKNTFGQGDMNTYHAILRRYQCPNASACREELANRIHESDHRITVDCLAALASATLGIILILVRRSRLRWYHVVSMLLFCATLLAGGVLSPMLEVEARISAVSLTFFGQPISFGEQVLYYQSKTVLEVFQTLLEIHRPEMLIVAVLLLLFSVIFPLLKILALGCSLIWPALLRNRLVKFFALESSKWSMADVMALSIFMSFVAFNGVISNALGALYAPGAQIVIPTDSSKILAGFYLFIGFVLTSLFLSWKIERDLRSGLVENGSSSA
ncbi:MAG TPA: paraquat-inducible protein A [Bryobacteraceae bacterium]|nr:paraquat-inducible protein A [Bryobacteraceae bacterium]